jgi:cytochrome P450
VKDPGALLFEPGAADAPQEAYRLVREECPVARVPGPMGNQTVYVSTYEDVLWALKHPEVFSSAAGAVDIGQDHPLIPLQVDPPEHAQYRRLLDPEFSPKRMRELEPDVRVLVNQLIDGFVDKGECEFHEDFATPLPSTIFLRLMGLPQSDLATFLEWRDDTIRPDTDDIDEAARIRAAVGPKITAYFTEQLAARRASPDDGLLTRIEHGEVDGRPLTRDEKLGTCHLFLLGGLDTVTATLDCMIAYLAQHPDERARLVADPALVDGTVEELLRTETPVTIVPRTVAVDATIGGVEIKAGDGCALLLGAANGDPHEFEAADVVDFERSANRHLAFGGGPHRCLGSHFARLELRVAIEEFHRRIPEYRIKDGVEIHYSAGIRQADHLPLVWGTSG